MKNIHKAIFTHEESNELGVIQEFFEITLIRDIGSFKRGDVFAIAEIDTINGYLKLYSHDFLTRKDDRRCYKFRITFNIESE